MGKEGRREIRSSLAPREEASRALRVLGGVFSFPVYGRCLKGFWGTVACTGLSREFPDGSSARYSVLFWFSLKCRASHGSHSYLHLECSAKPNTFSSPLKMRSNPLVKSLKGEMGEKMKQTFKFSLRSSSVHSLCLPRDVRWWYVCILQDTYVV